jgi:hypothetical protein
MQGQLKKFSDFGIKVDEKRLIGERVKLKNILDQEITVLYYQIVPSKYPKNGNEECLYLQIEIDSKKKVAFSIAKILMKTLREMPEENFPFTTTIKCIDEAYLFT